MTDRPWWLEPLSEAAGDLSAEVSGLSSRDAKAQLGRFGPNLFRERQEKSLLVQYLTRFKNPLITLGYQRPVSVVVLVVQETLFYDSATSASGRLPEITNGCFVEAKHENVVAERRTASEKLDRRFWVDAVEKPDFRAAPTRPQGGFLGLEPKFWVARRVV